MQRKCSITRLAKVCTFAYSKQVHHKFPAHPTQHWYSQQHVQTNSQEICSCSGRNHMPVLWTHFPLHTIVDKHHSHTGRASFHVFYRPVLYLLPSMYAEPCLSSCKPPNLCKVLHATGLVYWQLTSHAISLTISLHVLTRQGQKYSLATVCRRDFPVCLSVYLPALQVL